MQQEQNFLVESYRKLVGQHGFHVHGHVACKHILLPLSAGGDPAALPALTPNSRRRRNSFRSPLSFPFCSNTGRTAVPGVTTRRVLRHSPLPLRSATLQHTNSTSAQPAARPTLSASKLGFPSSDPCSIHRVILRRRSMRKFELCTQCLDDLSGVTNHSDPLSPLEVSSFFRWICTGTLYCCVASGSRSQRPYL